MDLPFPNLADVPKAPKAQPANEQAKITQQAHSGVSAPSPGALEGLTLPEGPPPVPNVPGVSLPATPTPSTAMAELNAESAPKPAPPAPPRPPAPPVAIGFAPGRALLPFSQTKKINAVLAARGDAHVVAGGFGDGSLTLALDRARRLADALTASGVPATDIRLTASAAGSGGFVQLVY